jgi:hypothetical protein
MIALYAAQAMRRLLISAALLLAARQSLAADDAPASITTAYSPYELEAIHAAERALGATLDPSPEGKIVERIDTIRLDPIEPRDPAPVAIDIVHTTTKEHVILHEMLLRTGDRWRGVVVDESARNLRQLENLSLVLCVPLKGSTPDRVRLVVITKDVWSLYPDFDLAITSGGLERLELDPKETNLFGTHDTLMGRLVLQPKSLSLGVAFVSPRLDRRWLSFVADGNVILERASGAPEGSFGTVSLTRPLYSTRTEWAWTVGTTWRDEIFRRYTNAQVAIFESQIPWQYRARTIEEQASVTRSFGWSKKNDFSVGADISHELYRVPDALAYDPATLDRFVRATVPTGETRVGPFVAWRAYSTDFLRILDFETLGLQEDYRLGHDVSVRVYPVLRALGSSRDFAGAHAGASYTIALGDGLARASVDTITEAEPDRLSDALVAGDLRLVSPRTGAGRLVFAATALNRYRNYLNRTSYVGGEDRLRGYPTRYFAGKDVVATNLEFRSRPVELFACQFGAAAFYDTGQAFDGFDHLHAAHSVGFGFRAVFPQIERLVLRGDIGFPISATPLPSDVAPVSFFITFGQAFRY